MNIEERNNIRSTSIMRAHEKIDNMEGKDRLWKHESRKKLNAFVILNMYDPPKLGFDFSNTECAICGHTEWLSLKIPSIFPMVCTHCKEQEVYMISDDETEMKTS